MLGVVLIAKILESMACYIFLSDDFFVFINNMEE